MLTGTDGLCSPGLRRPVPLPLFLLCASVCGIRLVKELESYKDESKLLAQRVKAMEDNKEDEYEIKQQVRGGTRTQAQVTITKSGLTCSLSHLD